MEGVIPAFRPDGCLPDGVHVADWQEFARRYGKTARRKELLKKARLGLLNLRDAGCEWVWLDGSFVTSKALPNDVDGCWEMAPGLDLSRLDESFLLRSFKDRVALLYDYGLDFFVAGATEAGSGLPFSEFFQFAPGGVRKGIIKMHLSTL